MTAAAAVAAAVNAAFPAVAVARVALARAVVEKHWRHLELHVELAATDAAAA